MSRTIFIQPRYQHLSDYIATVPDTMESDGKYIYGGRRNLIVSMTAPDGTVLNVKRYKIPSLPSNIVYSTGLRTPKGRRAYEYPQILAQKGIGTPEAVAYIEDRRCGLLRHSWLITIQCPYQHRTYEMGDAAPEVYEPMVEPLARFCAHMHDNEVLHLDFSPGNILWERVDGEYHFSIVDINRMHFGPVDMEQGVGSFSRLWGPKRFLCMLTRRYAELRGFDVAAAEQTMLTLRARFWHHYQKKREMEFTLEL